MRDVFRPDTRRAPRREPTRDAVEEVSVVDVAAVDDEHVLSARHRRETTELLEICRVQQGRALEDLGSGRERHRTPRGLERQDAGSDVEHLVVLQRERPHREMVGAQEGRRERRPVGERLEEPRTHLASERLPGGQQHLVVVEPLAGRGRAQRGHVDHAPHEERPGRQQVRDRCRQQHAA